MPSKKFKMVHRIPNSNILIDYWKPQTTQDKYHRFMTYLRIDGSESIKNICQSTYTIYTSLFNKWYLITYYQVSEHRLIDLRFNETIDVYDCHSNTTFSVTAFDANYYTGSLMFLFEGNFGKIFYTGFFRPSSFEPIFQVPILKSIIEKRELDVAYIDNTYAAEHCEFPTRSEVLDQIISCLRQHSKHKVAISGKRLGKEEILLKIAQALDEKICVSEDKFVILSRLNIQNYFTTDKRKSRIYAYDYIINPSQCLEKQARYGPYIVILLTAFYHCERNRVEDINIPGLYIFPYSGHCSHSELVRFVSQLKPRDVLPILKFEDVESSNSIIPPCISLLCHRPLPLPLPLSNSCMLPRAQKSSACYTDEERITDVFAVPSTVIRNFSGSKNPIITDVIPDTPTKNDLRCLEGIEEFFESVSNGSNGSNYESNISNSMMTANTTCNMSSQSPGVSGLSNSSLNKALTTPPSTKSQSCENALSDINCNQDEIIVQSIRSSNSVMENDLQNVDILQILNEDNIDPMPEMKIDFPITTSLPDVDTYDSYHTACSLQNNENVISTSCTTFDNPTIENMNMPCVLQNTPRNSVYPRSSYNENDIAENIISSTNNESFTDAIFSPVPISVEEPKHDEVSSRTITPSEFQCNENLSLQKSDIDSPMSLETQRANVRLEKNYSPERAIEAAKNYDDKATETDITGDKISRLEKLERSCGHDEEHQCMDKDIMKRIVNYMSTNERGKFDTNIYYNNLRRKNSSHDDKNCTIMNCKECETMKELELNKKKRKVINSTLYNYSLTLKSQKTFCTDQKWNNLNGCNILSHPIFKDMTFNN